MAISREVSVWPSQQTDPQEHQQCLQATALLGQHSARYHQQQPLVPEGVHLSHVEHPCRWHTASGVGKVSCGLM